MTSTRPPRDGVLAVLLGSGLSGLAAYGFQVLGTRALGEQGYAPVGVLWTLQFLLFTIVLHPVETWVARLRVLSIEDGGPQIRSAVRRLVMLGLLLALLLGIAAVLARGALFNDEPWLAAVVPVSVLGYGAYVVVRGLLAGAGRYHAYAVATGTESVLRLVLAGAVLMVGATTYRLAWTLPLGAVAAAGVWWAAPRPGRMEMAATPLLLDEAMPGPGRFLAATVAANAAAQTLLAAGPLVAVPLGASAAEVSVCFVTVTLVRAPLVFGYGGLLSRLLPPLTRRAQAGDTAGLRALGLRVVPVSLAFGAVGGTVAAGLGPTLVQAFFGAGFRPEPVFIGTAAAAALLATGNLLLNQVLVARHSEQRLVLPWLGALAVAGGILVSAGGPPLVSIGAALLAGEVVAMAGLAVSLATAGALVPAEARGACADAQAAPAAGQRDRRDF